jgi:hypothetical protein
MFEVTSRKHVSTAVAEDLRYKVWIVEAGSRVNAQALLLEAVFPTRVARGQRLQSGTGSQEEESTSSDQINGLKSHQGC